MTYDLEKDADFQAIAQEVERAGGLLQDAWVMHKNEKWFPYRYEDRETKKIGFEVNPTGQRGSKDKRGKEKLYLEAFLQRLANNQFPRAANIRCTPKKGRTPEVRVLRKLETSARLENLLKRISQSAQPSLPQHISGSMFVGPEESEEHDSLRETPASGDGTLSGAGYCDDPAARKAIEAHAVQQARQFYERHGYLVTERGKPFDLLCQKSDEILHVEVKGSRSSMREIILTANEVKDARDPGCISDLFLVENISLEISDQGSYKASGGHCRRTSGWSPAEQHLTPTEYRYKLPLIPDAE